MKKRKRRVIRFAAMLAVLLGLMIWGLFKLHGDEGREEAARAEGFVKEEAARAEGFVKEEAAGKKELEGKKTEEKEPEAVAPSSEEEREEPLEKQVQEKLAAMTTEEKVAQLFFITPEALTGASPVQSAGEASWESFRRYPVGGLICFGQNLQNEGQTREMLEGFQQISRERIGLPLFTGVDEEGGTVRRIAGNPGFSAQDVGDMRNVGATGDPEQAYQAGRTLGSYLSGLGFNLDFAPCADVLTNPSNTVVSRRSFGSDPQLVSQMVCRQMDGLEEEGVFACPKHFPGHGSTEGDTHQGYSYTGKTLEELEGRELAPFSAVIERGSDFLMVGHISLPNALEQDLPASLSREAITGLLRERMGYEGLVITDALNMGAIQNTYSSAQAAVLSFQAGSDLLLMPADFRSAYEGVLGAVQREEISRERLDASVARILRVKLGI